MPTAPLSYIPPHQTLYSSMANCMCHFCCLRKRYRTSMMFSCNYYVLIWNTNCGVLSAVSEAGVSSVLVLAIFALPRLTWRGWKLRIQLVSGLCQKKESSRLRGGVLSDRASGNPNGIPSTSEACGCGVLLLEKEHQESLPDSLLSLSVTSFTWSPVEEKPSGLLLRYRENKKLCCFFFKITFHFLKKFEKKSIRPNWACFRSIGLTV